MHECGVCGQTFRHANGLGCHQTTQRHYPPRPPSAREAWAALTAATDPDLRASLRVVFSAALARYDRAVMV